MLFMTNTRRPGSLDLDPGHRGANLAQVDGTAVCRGCAGGDNCRVAKAVAHGVGMGEA